MNNLTIKCTGCGEDIHGRKQTNSLAKCDACKEESKRLLSVKWNEIKRNESAVRMAERRRLIEERKKESERTKKCTYCLGRLPKHKQRYCSPEHRMADYHSVPSQNPYRVKYHSASAA